MPSLFGAASIPFIGCVALLAAQILTILAFASPYWATVDGGQSVGLWRRAGCEPGKTGADREDCTRWDMLWSGNGKYWKYGDWLHATRAMESLAIIFFAIPLIVLPVYFYVALGLYYRCTMGIMTISSFLGTACNITGFIIYGVEIGSNDAWKLGWCLIICVIGGGLGLIATIIFLIATINKPEFVPQRYLSSKLYLDQDKSQLYVVDMDEPVKVIYAQSEAPAAIVEPGQVNPSFQPEWS